MTPLPRPGHAERHLHHDPETGHHQPITRAASLVSSGQGQPLRKRPGLLARIVLAHVSQHEFFEAYVAGLEGRVAPSSFAGAGGRSCLGGVFLVGDRRCARRAAGPGGGKLPRA
jgi:hypothetical protein